MEEQWTQVKFTKEALRFPTYFFGVWKTPLAQLGELERQVAAAFVFGMINGLAFLHKADPPTALSATKAVLERRFLYEKKQAGDFAQELVNCTAPGYHDTVYAIIQRGIDGFFALQAGDDAAFAQNVTDVMETVCNAATGIQ